MSSSWDSISSSGSYYNNQFREDHGAKTGYQKLARAQYLDSMSSHQKQLDRHVLLQFQKNHSQAPMNKIVIVAQVGRYLVLALILPPYFVLYRGPKWVMIQLQPPLEFTSDKLNQLIFFLTTTSVDIWAGFKQRMQKPKNFIKKNVEALKKGLERSLAAFSLPMREIVKPFQLFLHKVHNFTSAYKDSYARAREWFYTLPSVMRQDWSSHLSRLKKAFSDRASKIMQQLMASIKIGKKALPKRPNFFMAFIGTEAGKLLEPMKKLKHAIENGVKQINNMFNQFIQHIKKPVEKGFKALVKPINAVKEAAKTAVQEISSRVQALSKGVQNFAVLTVVPFQSVSKSIRHWGIGVKGQVEGMLRGVKLFSPALKRVAKTLWDEGKKRGRQFKEQVKKALQLTKTALFLAFEKAKQIPLRVMRLWDRFKTWALHTYRKAVIVGRIILAWTKVLVRYSLEQLWN